MNPKLKGKQGTLRDRLITAAKKNILGETTTLTDSLTALTGGGNPVQISADAVDVGGGEYDPKRDQIFLAPDASRDVIAHEFGHRYDGKGKLQAMIPTPALMPTGRRQFTNGPDTYHAEAAADVFANAVKYLQSSDSRASDAVNRLGTYEAAHPGTGEVVRTLLQESTYAKHPLRSKITPLAGTSDSYATLRRLLANKSKSP